MAANGINENKLIRQQFNQIWFLEINEMKPKFDECRIAWLYFSPVSKSSVNHQMKLRFINEIEVGFIAAMNQTAIELKTTAFHW